MERTLLVCSLVQLAFALAAAVSAVFFGGMGVSALVGMSFLAWGVSLGYR